MGVNKVIYGGETLIDLTEDTVTSESLLAGETAHDASGESIVGAATHGSLSGRDEANQHPISAIFGLQSALNDCLQSSGGGSIAYSEEFGSPPHNWFINGDSFFTQVTVTLPHSGWIGTSAPYSQTISVSGVTESSAGEVAVDDSATDEQYEAAVDGIIRKCGQGTGTMSFKAYGDAPSVDIPIIVTIFA